MSRHITPFGCATKHPKSALLPRRQRGGFYACHVCSAVGGGNAICPNHHSTLANIACWPQMPRANTALMRQPQSPMLRLQKPHQPSHSRSRGYSIASMKDPASPQDEDFFCLEITLARMRFDTRAMEFRNRNNHVILTYIRTRIMLNTTSSYSDI